MRVEELRIGSILSYKGKKFKILEISQNKLKAQSNKGLVIFEVSELEPIELTEEILLKCGFSEYDLEIGRIILTEDGGFIITRLSQNVILKTLHQLQNLYFALTNEELEINL